MGTKYTLEMAKAALVSKGLDHLQPVFIDPPNIKVLDDRYGEYLADLKSLSPSMDFPMHPGRRHTNRMQAEREKLIGTTINGLKITDVFYGPDKGYKNRSFYLDYIGECGHSCTAPKAFLMRHKKTAKCQKCCKIQHGARGLEEGARKKRTSTYVHWSKVHPSLPDEFKDFAYFRAVAGDKPYKRAELVFKEGRLYWSSLETSTDPELNLIASAIRQAFRHSTIYKNCLRASLVQTPDGPRHRCASCFELFKKSHVQVDHIDPIMPLDGTPLDRNSLLPRIWTDKIQVLDKACHSKKSTAENKLRKANKVKSDLINGR